MEKLILETERLVLRRLTREDIEEVSLILGDIEVMYAWEKAFSQKEAAEWIDKNLKRYEEEGYSYLIAHEKESGRCIGLMGPLMERIEGRNYPGIAYIIHKRYWKQGYAVEGTKACINYLFNKTDAEEVIVQIKYDNEPSTGVAKKLGVTFKYEYIKEYDGKKMPHLIFSVSREEFRSEKPV